MSYLQTLKLWAQGWPGYEALSSFTVAASIPNDFSITALVMFGSKI